MALDTVCLVDKSALARVHHPSVRAILKRLTYRGLLATCSIIDLEVGYSATGAAEHKTLISQRRGLLSCPIGQSTLDRALDIQSLLAARGQHRVSLPDLIIAACADENGAVVVHYDKVFDTIARVTGQEVRWIAPRGSLP